MVESWQVPLLVMASIIVLELVVGAALRRWNSTAARQAMRTGALGLLAVLVLGVGVRTLGPDLADQLASVAAAVATIVALWLTYRSFQASQSGGSAGDPPPDAGPPAPPTPPPPPRPPASDNPATLADRSTSTTS